MTATEKLCWILFELFLILSKYHGCFTKTYYTPSISPKTSTPSILENFKFQFNCGISSLEGNLYGKFLNNRIINGDNVENDYFPWIVKLINSIDNKWYHNCGGTLISNQHVLTAAHCVYGNSYELKVVVGVFDFEFQVEQENVFDPIDIVIHPSYKGNDNDIAVLKLSRPVNKSIYPLCLPNSENTEVIFEKKLVTAGWGVTDGNYFGGSNPKLFKSELFVINGQNICLKNNNLYCVLDTSSKKSNICYGDSGGPLMYFMNGNWYIYGVACCATVDINGKCSNNYPSYFTIVPKFINWINQIIV